MCYILIGHFASGRFSGRTWRLQMSDDGILFKGIAIMAAISIAAGLFVVAAVSTAQPGDHYTALYMNTGAIDRNITRNNTSLTIPFYVENHEGGDVNYRYTASIEFKDTVFHKGIDSWSEDLNVDDQLDVAGGTITVMDNQTAGVLILVPVQSQQKWRYANVTLELYKEGTQGVYRSLRLWAFNQVQ
jgi:hypothetical protein